MPLDRFGSERADDDYARGDTYKELFLETRSIKEFFNRDPGYRYVLGTMGSGKSLLLLKLREHIESTQAHAVIAPTVGGRVFTPSAEFATSLHWTTFWKLEKDGRQNVTVWTQVWEWALLRCILLEWLKWTKGAAAKHALRIAELTSIEIFGPSSDPFVSIAVFIASANAPGLAGNPQLPPSGEMRAFVEEHANDFPPTYVFVDSQDDFFQENPEFWTASALGCKYAIDQVVRRSNHRIHLVMTLRPEMLWQAKTDADALRFKGDMFQIQWTAEHVLGIFRRRAGLLRDDLLLLPELRSTNPFAAFFGAEYFPKYEASGRAMIDNHAVGIDSPLPEPLEQYLFRHTLGRPREIILIGNQILDQRSRSTRGDDQSTVRSAVAQAAHSIALAYIGEIKQRWPWRDAGSESAADSLQRFLRDHVGANVLMTKDLRAIEKDFLETCKDVDPAPDSGPFSVLASAGLIGWPVLDKDDRQMVYQFFPNTGAPDSLGQRIPKTVKAVLVHPVLYGSEFAIQARKGLVVGPGVRTPIATAKKLDLIY